MAREQKVDLAKISILALADQYLAFIDRQQKVHLEIAADYLVMAAWLAYLKSRLLLPEPPQEDEPEAAEIAAVLGHRLKLLPEAMQTAGRRRLMARIPVLGRDFFLRGSPEGLAEVAVPVWRLGLYEMLHAYADTRRRGAVAVLAIEPSVFHSDGRRAEALIALSRPDARLARADALSSFSSRGANKFAASARSPQPLRLRSELARDRRVELRQDHMFGPLYLRSPPAAAKPEGGERARR